MFQLAANVELLFSEAGPGYEDRTRIPPDGHIQAVRAMHPEACAIWLSPKASRHS